MGRVSTAQVSQGLVGILCLRVSLSSRFSLTFELECAKIEQQSVG